LIGSLREWVRLLAAGDDGRCTGFQVQQLIGGAVASCSSTPGSIGGLEMGRHARDDDARSAGLDDLAEFVQGQCDTEQVDSQDGFHRALQWRESGRVDDVVSRPHEPAKSASSAMERCDVTSTRLAADVVTVNH